MTVGKNNIDAPKKRNNFIFFQYLYFSLNLMLLTFAIIEEKNGRKELAPKNEANKISER